MAAKYVEIYCQTKDPHFLGNNNLIRKVNVLLQRIFSKRCLVGKKFWVVKKWVYRMVAESVYLLCFSFHFFPKQNCEYLLAADWSCNLE